MTPEEKKRVREFFDRMRKPYREKLGEGYDDMVGLAAAMLTCAGVVIPDFATAGDVMEGSRLLQEQQPARLAIVRSFPPTAEKVRQLGGRPDDWYAWFVEQINSRRESMPASFAGDFSPRRILRVVSRRPDGLPSKVRFDRVN